MASMISTGPLYFYDQVKMKTIKRAKKMPEELPPDMKYMNINPRLANFINSINKNKKGVSTQAEKKQLLLPNEEKARKEKEKYPVLPEINGSNPPKNSIEIPNPKPAHFPTEDDQFMSPFDDYKYVAPTLLYELGKLLHFFSQYEIIFPQGVINVLYYNWKELIEGAVYNKRHCQSQLYKKGTADQNQVPEENDNKQPGAGTVPPENVDSLKNTKNKTNTTLAESGKEKGGHETNKASGNKSPQSFATHLPVTISFSMASRACEDRGWIFQKTDSESEAMELKGLCTWAVERLQLAQIQINKQLTSMAERGWTKPVVLRYYENNKKAPEVKQRKTVKAPLFMLVNGMPRIPEIKRDNPSLRKLHYGLIDGSSVVYYPSGHLAVCQSCSGLSCGGFYTNIFSPEQVMLGTFTPFGHGSICFPGSNTFALHYNQEGGMMTDKEGEIVKEWQWSHKAKLPDPITLQVNEYLSVRILGQSAISLIYKWQHETVRLSLSPLLDVSPPQLEELGQLLTNEHFSSRTAKELSKTHRKKGKEKDTKKTSKKATILSELAKTLEIPENPISALNDSNAATELRKLQRKVRNIVDDWMEHYRLASGVDSPHIKKMPKAPPRMSHKRKIQSAAVFPVTSLTPESKPVQQTDIVADPVSDNRLLHGRFQSAPIQSYIRRWGTPQSSLSPRPSSMRSVKKDQTTAELSLDLNTSGLQIASKSGIHLDTSRPLMSIEHDSEKLWHMSNQACPVVIRNVMLGEEERLCRCSNNQIPYVTDLEYDQLINNTSSHTDQITVVCVVSSSTLEEDQSKDMLDQLYEKKNRYRSMPCMQSRLDSFRLLKYDISSSNEITGHKNSLLVQRHNVTPGMVLMYIHGKLLFANYIFNGYSRSVKDLQKQIAQTRSDYQMGLSLPKDFKFSHGGHQKGQEKTIY